MPLPNVKIFQSERWGGVDKRKKRPRTASQGDASTDGAMEEDVDPLAEPEVKVIY